MKSRGFTEWCLSIHWKGNRRGLKQDRIGFRAELEKGQREALGQNSSRTREISEQNSNRTKKTSGQNSSRTGDGSRYNSHRILEVSGQNFSSAREASNRTGNALWHKKFLARTQARQGQTLAQRAGGSSRSSVSNVYWYRSEVGTPASETKSPTTYNICH